MKFKSTLINIRLILSLSILFSLLLRQIFPTPVLNFEFLFTDVYLYIGIIFIVLNSSFDLVFSILKEKGLYIKENSGYFFPLIILMLFLLLAQRYLDIGLISFLFFLRYYSCNLNENLKSYLELPYKTQLSNLEKKYLNTSRHIALLFTFVGFSLFLSGAFICPYPLSETLSYIGIGLVAMSSSRTSFLFVSFMLDQVINVAACSSIYIKKKSTIENLNSSTNIIFNKGDVITTEEYSLKYVKPVDMDARELLQLAAYGLYHSTHPISQVIKKSAGPIDPSIISHYRNIVAHGASVHVLSKVLYVGNYKLMCQMQFNDMFLDKDSTLVHVSSADKYLGCIALENALEPTAKSAINELNRLGLTKSHIFTGDRYITTEKIAKDFGISKIYCDLSPRRKADYLEEIKKAMDEKEKLIFVAGNETEMRLLSNSDVGMFISSLEEDSFQCDAILKTRNLALIPFLIKLSRRAIKKAKRIMRINYIFKLIPIPLILIGIFSPIPAFFALLLSDLLSFAICKRK